MLRFRARNQRLQPGKQLTAVRQVGQRVVFREVAQLKGSFFDPSFQLGLVRLDRLLRSIELGCKMVEGLREFVHLGGSTTWHPRGEVTGRQLPRARCQSSHRPGNRPGGYDQ